MNKNVSPNLSNNPDDGRVRVHNNAQRNDPSSNKENQDEDLGSHIFGQVIKTASSEVTFGFVFSYTEERRKGQNIARTSRVTQ